MWTMATCLRHGLSVCAALVQLAAAVVFPSGHEHPVAFAPGSASRAAGAGAHIPDITSHDCGPVERHHPAQSDFHCVLCQRHTQFVATPACGCNATADENCSELLTERESPSARAFTAQSHLRGPPISI
jgi:hypothetical protein